MTRDNWEASWRQLSETALPSIKKASSLEELEALRVDLLGRQGRLTELLKALKNLPLEDRRKFGAPSNQLKEELAEAVDQQRKALEEARVESEISRTSIDLTLPGSPSPAGRAHPLTRMLDEMAGILSRMGFSWAEGPLVETERNNFDALNIPGDHPARDMLDTFYIKTEGKPSSLLLRTHTSPVQIRYMETHRPPLRIMAPGRVFRHEAVDASHSAVFHQIEGLYVDKQVSLADLKGTLRLFLQGLFGRDVKTRFRPSYFPFTEPSAEMDIGCLLCGGGGCPACKRSGWMEILGAGLVHPDVFKAVGYDPNEWSGFAFGVGVERVSMLRLGINDIRAFYQNDLRFLEQFE